LQKTGEELSPAAVENIARIACQGAPLLAGVELITKQATAATKAISAMSN
jgi:hypothetical protein